MSVQTGIFEYMPMKDYQAIPAINMSSLHYMARSPAHLKAEQSRKERKVTDSLVFGSLVHCLILEPQNYPQEYICCPHHDRRTKEYKEWMLRFAQGRNIITEMMLCEAERAASAVLTHPAYLNLSRGLKTEVSLVWQCKTTGEYCKARLDALNEAEGIVLDVKTTRDARKESFQRDIFTLGYDNKTAWYLWGAACLGIKLDHFIYFCVEKESPYACAAYRIEDTVSSLAHAENEEMLTLYAECKKKDSWPGYSTEIQDIGIPQWALNQMEGEYGDRE